MHRRRRGGGGGGALSGSLGITRDHAELRVVPGRGGGEGTYFISGKGGEIWVVGGGEPSGGDPRG